MFDGIKTRVRRTRSAVGVLRLLLVIALIGPAAVLVFVTLQARALLLDAAADRATRMAELVAQHATATFDSYNVAFGRIEEHLLHAEGLFQEQPLHGYLAELDRGMKSVDALILVDANGVALAHSRFFPVPKTYIGDRDYIRDIEAPPEGARLALVQGRDGLTVGVPIRSRYSGKTVLPVARARRDLTGRVSGVVAASVAQDYFEDFYRTLALTGSDRVALVRADARVLAQIPAVPGRPAIDLDTADGLDVAALASADPGPEQAASEGVSRVSAKDPATGMIDYVSPADEVRRISSLHKLDGYPVYVEVGFSLDAVLEPWRRQALINLAVAALATLVLFTLARLALTKTRTEAAMQAQMLAEAHRRADAEAALRQAQKMEALGQLTGGIAHDFNNLLNVVLINLELAAKRLTDRQAADLDRLQAHVSGAMQGAERGVALTRRLLAFAHRQEAKPGPVQVSDLVLGLAELLKQAVGTRARIALDCPTGLAPARADPNELETALLNLVVNARDAIPESGGRIHIGVREAQASVPLSGTVARFIVLSVQDDGSGMDAAVLMRVTEPFFTTKEVGKGSGLGLAMVDRFALESGGRLVLESRPGAGTTVEIWLPPA